MFQLAHTPESQIINAAKSNGFVELHLKDAVPQLVEPDLIKLIEKITWLANEMRLNTQVYRDYVLRETVLQIWDPDRFPKSVSSPPQGDRHDNSNKGQ